MLDRPLRFTSPLYTYGMLKNITHESSHEVEVVFYDATTWRHVTNKHPTPRAVDKIY